MQDIKRCSKCKIEKSLKDFTILKTTGKILSWCKECYKHRNKNLYHYECVDCGKPCQRNKTNTIEKENAKSNRCNKCAKNKIIKDNGGVPINYNGTYNFSGKSYSAWKSSAKRRGINWKITKQQMEDVFKKQNGKCALSGMEMIPRKNTPYRPSIDRIDSTKGYSIDNIQFVCSMVNVMKNKFNEKDFIKMCCLIAKFKGEKNENN